MIHRKERKKIDLYYPIHRFLKSLMSHNLTFLRYFGWTQVIGIGYYVIKILFVAYLFCKCCPPQLLIRPINKTHCFFFSGIGGGYSLGHDNRCGSMSRAPRNPHVKIPSTAQISRSQSFAQGGAASPHSHSRGEKDEEDSMHEKYFLKKLESSQSTPQVNS